ncbi:MAG TPA: hypothetical protein VFA34_16570 [Actinomycetota bacterium]|jgi:hypothetical protein|nr:hypothetical protein [Actinomycetota bacterium]
MIGPKATRDTYLTLESVLAHRNVPKRDCRSCPKFVPDADGFGCGWCEAHKMWVKLYAAPEKWYSQCQFRFIRAERALVR